jgi:hypothetical protein
MLLWRVCWQTLAKGFGASASDAGTPLHQTLVEPLFPRLSCGGFQRFFDAVATDAVARLSVVHWTRLSASSVKMTSLCCVCQCDIR